MYLTGVQIVKIDINTSLVIVKGSFDPNDLVACINMTAVNMNKKNKTTLNKRKNMKENMAKTRDIILCA